MKNLASQGQDSTQSFKELYNSLPGRSTAIPPKKAFVKKIASVTMKSETTVRCWLSGSQNPDALSKSMISKELGVSCEVLFPKKREEACEQ